MKPLTRYALESYVQERHERHEMTPDPDGNYYAKDEADAVIRELTRQRDNAQQFLDECSVSVAELSEQVAQLESERDAALQAVDDLRAERVEVAELEAAVDAWRRDCDAARADAERLRGELLAAASVLETCRYSEQPAAKRARDAARSKP